MEEQPMKQTTAAAAEAPAVEPVDAPKQTVSIAVPEGVPDGPEAIHHNGRFYEVVKGILEVPVHEVEAFLKRGFKKVD
jgi:hypothetical protein